MLTDPATDRRILRTKEAIRLALIDLIQEIGFDALTVKDITTRARVNRGTFYLHYQDKFDLLDQTEDEIIGHIEKIFLKLNSVNLTDFSNVHQPLPVLIELFEYLKANAALMHAILGIHGDVTFQTKMRKAIERNLGVIFQALGKELTFLVPGDYLISYLLAAHLGTVQNWLQKGCLETPQEMAQILWTITYHGPLYASGLK